MNETDFILLVISSVLVYGSFLRGIFEYRLRLRAR